MTIILRGNDAREFREAQATPCPECGGILEPLKFKPPQNRFKWFCSNHTCSQYKKSKSYMQVIRGIIK